MLTLPPPHPLHSVVASLQQGHTEVQAHLDQWPRLLPTGGGQHLEEHHCCAMLAEVGLVVTETGTQLRKFLEWDKKENCSLLIHSYISWAPPCSSW